MSKPRREGWLYVDDRNSGGLLLESATVTCLHCNRVVVLNPDRKRPRGYCAKCDGYVCDSPECGLSCYPFENLCDDILNRGADTNG